MEKAEKTKQQTSPWYCRVIDNEATSASLAAYEARKGKKGKAPKPIYKFSLYFDAGSERKLQVKGLMKKFCTVHATWKFDSVQLAAAEPEKKGDDDAD